MPSTKGSPLRLPEPDGGVSGEDSGMLESDHEGEGVRGMSSLNDTGEIARVTGVEAKWTRLRSMAIVCAVRCFNADLRMLALGKEESLEMMDGLGEDASVANSSASRVDMWLATTVGSTLSIAEVNAQRRKQDKKLKTKG